MCACVAQCRDPNRHARRVVAAVQIHQTISNDVESMDGSFYVVGCRPVGLSQDSGACDRRLSSMLQCTLGW